MVAEVTIIVAVLSSVPRTLASRVHVLLVLLVLVVLPRAVRVGPLDRRVADFREVIDSLHFLFGPFNAALRAARLRRFAGF